MPLYFIFWTIEKNKTKTSANFQADNVKFLWFYSDLITILSLSVYVIFIDILILTNLEVFYWVPMPVQIMWYTVELGWLEH